MTPVFARWFCVFNDREYGPFRTEDEAATRYRALEADEDEKWFKEIVVPTHSKSCPTCED